MDENEVSAFTLRNPLFSKNEINVLIDLVEEHKSILLDKATNAAACFAKETAWKSVSKSFNSRGFQHMRSTESIKLKWDNVKKATRKKAKESANGFYDPITSRVVTLLSENNLLYEIKPNGVDDFFMDDDDQSKDQDSPEDPNDVKQNNDVEHLLFDSTGSNGNVLSDDRTDVDKPSRNRNIIFTSSECNRLLSCAKAEKNVIFSKDTSLKSMELKHKAWDRIALAFNKNRSHCRSQKELCDKFESMKKYAKQATQLPDCSKKSKNSLVNSNNETKKSSEHLNKTVKLEAQLSDDSYMDDHVSDADNFLITELLDDDSNPESRLIISDVACDPLSNVLNGFADGSDYKKDLRELVKLKLELTKYKLEMAKESRRQKKEAHDALIVSLATRTRLAELETKRVELQIAALNSEQRNAR